VAGGGFAPSVIHSSYVAPPENTATLTYTPLTKKDDTVVVDQATAPQLFAVRDGTHNMSHLSHCPSGSSAEFCDPDRHHAAMAFPIEVQWPREDRSRKSTFPPRTSTVRTG
jgi:hypothetical protein